MAMLPVKKRIASLAIILSMYNVSAVSKTINWVHPGVMVSQSQLDYVRQQLLAKAEPETTLLAKAKKSKWGLINYKIQGPPADGVISCGPSSKPDIGCNAAQSDTSAAYLQAVIWAVTGDKGYLANSIKIMNTYLYNLKGYSESTPGFSCPGAKGSCSNGPLQTAWDFAKMTRTAEILRYANGGSAGWAPQDAQAFGQMLKKVVLPGIVNGSGNNGNWEIIMIEAMMGVAVYNEDAALLEHARSMWRERIPSYFYNYELDGNAPRPFPKGRETSRKWNGQEIFAASTNGVMQETCRDMHHAAFGLASSTYAAETDYLQGGTLYTDNNMAKRITTSMNVMAGIFLANSTTAPKDFCTGVSNKVILDIVSTFSLAYNHYHNRLNDPNMADASGTSGLWGTANTYNWIQKGVLAQPFTSDGGAHMVIFEPLTHSGLGVSTPGYSLTAIPNVQNTNPGGTTTYTVTVAGIGGHTDNVELNVESGLPTGAVATFIPVQITGGSGTSVVTITTSTTTPAGKYKVNIRATDGSITKSTVVELHVTAPTYDVSISPQTETVHPGAAAVYTVKVDPLFGYNQTVNLNLRDSSPATTSAIFTPSAITGGSGTSTLTVQTAATTPEGSYALNIVASDANMQSKSMSAELVVKTNDDVTVTIKAKDRSMDKGDSVPKLKYSDKPNVDKYVTKPSCTTTATSSSPKGKYPITCSGAVATGYQFTYVDGVLKVK